MDLDTLANLGEFIGGVFVVVTLIYLAYQLRQNTRSLQIENYARVLERMSLLQSRLALEANLNRLFLVGAEDPGRLTPGERARFAWALYELFGAAEFMYHQSLNKVLEPAVWRRWEQSVRWWLSYPGIRSWWAVKPAPLTEPFEGFVEKLMHDKPLDPEVTERWSAFLAGTETPPSPRPAA